MTRIVVGPNDGWAGLDAALRDAKPGDVVAVEPGGYESDSTLQVGSGVTLDAAGAVLHHRGHGPALEARGVTDVAIRGLHVAMLSRDVPLKLEPDAEPYRDQKSDVELGLIWRVQVQETVVSEFSIKGTVEWGLIWLDRVRGATVADVMVKAAGGPFHGIMVRDSEDVKIERVDVAGVGLSGITVASSTGCRVARSRITRCGLTGVILNRACGSDGPTSCEVTANRCHDNGQAGIALTSSTAPMIEDNDCRRNGRSGISLQSDPHSSEVRSNALIIANRCHDNGGSGIELLSSTASIIEKNDCWGNKSCGILLHRDPENPDVPSEARITANRCHDNGTDGIALCSSTAPVIRDNDCWGNLEEGISLKRIWDRRAVASKALIIANRCHDNLGSGIRLTSSEAPAIEGNDCWRNAFGGIALVPSVNIGAIIAPTVVERITANRSYKNSIVGILLQSSVAEAIQDNDCWENGESGIRLQRDDERPGAEATAELARNRLGANKRYALLLEHNGAVLTNFEENRDWEPSQGAVYMFRREDGGLYPNPEVPFEFDFLPEPSAELLAKRDEAAERARLAGPHGSLARRLAKEGLRDPERLARFLTGPGCARSLLRWWLGPNHPDPLTWPPEPEDGAAETPGSAEHSDLALPRRYACRHEAAREPTGTERLVFTAEGDEAPERALWAAILAAASADEDDTIRLGLVTAGDRKDGAPGQVFDRLAEDVAGYRRLVSGHEGDPDILSPDARPYFRQLRNVRQQRKVAAQIADPVVIDYTDGGPDGALPLDAALLAGRHRVVVALGVLVRTPAAWFTIVAAAVFFLGAFYLVGVWRGAEGDSMDFVATVRRGWTGSSNSVSGWDVAFLPVKLLAIAGAVITVMLPHLPAALRPKLTSNLRARLNMRDVPPAERPSAWTRWVRRRVFRGGVAVVAVRGAAEWGEQDAAALRRLLDARPPGGRLVLALHTASRNMVDRAVLRPLALVEGKPDFKQLDGLGLVVGRAAEQIQLKDDEGDGPPRPLPTKAGLAELLGLASGENIDRHRNNISDGNWAVRDLVPMVTIGSTVEAPFVLDRPANERAGVFAGPLAETLTPFVRLFEGKPDYQLDLSDDTAALNELIGEAERSPAIAVTSWGTDGQKMLSFIGRAGQRQRLVDHLEAVFDDTHERRTYVIRMLACGELHAMITARRALEGPKQLDAAALRTALRALRSAGALYAEIVALGGLDSDRQGLLEEERDRLAQSLAKATPSYPGSDYGDEGARQVHRLAALLACRAGSMGLLDDAAALKAQDDEDLPPIAAALRARVKRAAQLRRERDPAVAATLAWEALHAERREADDALWNAIWRKVEDAGRAERSLSELVWSARDKDALRALLADHAGMGGMAITVVLLQLTGWGDEEANLRAARLIDRCRKACRKTGAVPELPPRGYQTWPTWRTSDLKVATLLKLLEEEEIVEVLAQAGAGQGRANSATPEVELGYFDPVEGQTSATVELVFEDGHGAVRTSQSSASSTETAS